MSLWVQMSETIVCFGAIDPEGKARVRPGCYGVVVNSAGQVAVAKTGNYILPGGGKDDGESDEETLRREVREETGLRIVEPELIWVADHIFTSGSGELICKRCRYYSAASLGQQFPKEEDDHELLWMGYDEALGKLELDCDRWALRKAEPRFAKLQAMAEAPPNW